ncbi:MAG: class I SAM-dependent methyltransferase [Colwellia sp.]|nr:class I SAM-dependent methyltransferase [Colwellia sp.]NQZ80656.1 class I SAM-dependent methyltransferase [Colwellia sp.]
MGDKMNNQQEWEAVYSSDTSRHKNKYPSELLVSWVMRNFGSTPYENRNILKCLDIGCGYGNNLKFLTDEGFNAVGIDFSPSVVSAVNDSGLKAIHSSAINTPFNDQEFDFILDRSAIQCNSKEDIVKIYNEILRLLKPGGRFFSVFKKTGDNGFETSLHTDQEIHKLLVPFSDYSIDYYSLTMNNQESELSAFLISAIK